MLLQFGVCFCSVLETNARALNMLGKHSIPGYIPSAINVQVIKLSGQVLAQHVHGPVPPTGGTGKTI